MEYSNVRISDFRILYSATNCEILYDPSQLIGLSSLRSGGEVTWRIRK